MKTNQDIDDSRLIPPTYWLGIPILTYAVLWLTPLLGWELWNKLIPNEVGFLETGTVVFLFPASVISFYLFSRRAKVPTTVRVWMLLIGLAAFLFAAEEMSWGQSYFEWKTPDTWGEINRQDETNLHNLEFPGSDIFNNLPRQGLLLACLVGGILLPLTKQKIVARSRISEFWQWIIPPWTIMPTSSAAS